MVFLLHFLLCTLPENPVNSKNASFSIVFKTSDGTLCPHSAVDTAGKKLQIGIALIYPEYFDSIKVAAGADGQTELKTVFREFSNEVHSDTLWTEHAFSTAGVKSVIVTPYITPSREPIKTTITIVADGIENRNPEWSIDTLPVSLRDTATNSVNLSDLCTDPDGDVLHFFLLPGDPERDTVTGDNYSISGTEAGISVRYPVVIATDPHGAADTVVLRVSVVGNDVDTPPPGITLVSPAAETCITYFDTFVIVVICDDPGDIDKVEATANGTIFPAIFSSGQYLMTVRGLTAGSDNTVIITATDASPQANKATKSVTITRTQTYSVLYDGNGNTGGTAPVDTNRYEPEATATVQTNSGNLVKTGFAFTGWNTAENRTGTEYQPGDTFTMKSDTRTLYAQWAAVQCALRYNGNGNTGGSAPETTPVDSGTSVTVASNTGNLTRTGYIFSGWNTDPKGTGTTYAAGTGKITLTADTVMYAKWTIKTYTLTYTGNGNTGGSVPATASPYDSNATVTIAANTGNLIKTGYDFNGWNSSREGTGSGFSPGTTLKIRSDTTLYVKWNIKQYTVTYLGNNQSSGTAPVDAVQHDSNSTVLVAGNTGDLKRDEYRFAGWNASANGNGSTYAIGSAIQKIRSDTVLYVLWIKQCTITYTCNNCDSHYSGAVPDTATFDSNTTANVANNTGSLKRDAYVFRGWNTAENGTGNDYTAGSNFTISSSITLYPKWTIMDADSNIYTEVTIGNQTWMVENLKTTKYYTGASIRHVTDSSTWWNAITAAYCWYDNTEDYKEPFGALYNWYTANSGMLAPQGWRIPSNSDWQQLIAAAGGEDVAGSHLKATTHWGLPDVGKEDNQTGFSALPGGGRYYTGASYDGFLGGEDSFGFWWSSDSYDDSIAYACKMTLYNTQAYVDEGCNKFYGLSVRCIRDY